MTDQQVIFMNPQTENLEYLYSLVRKIAQQMKENKLKRNDLLKEIDVLVKEVNSSQPKSGMRDPNLSVISNFLKQRDIDVEDRRQRSDTTSDPELACLQEQNAILRKMFQEKCCYNNETLALLKVHEEYLAEVVSLLRGDVLSYHQSLVEKCREIYDGRLCLLEDEEFGHYIGGIDNLQELLEISEIFRGLLRLT
ncbi:LADA_0F06480g1_1 [Lachancea dasiensis]|uniref:LADA_0F06480g1_1 n=1 Tax=Lachancea dasiensis TaxID=1072105 RepID=A0A1G4JK41_9SACH|nr:LADA_0F06480g1_1 [Lachancea dasiensis]